MTTFSKDEIYTATEVVRNFSAVLGKVGKAQMKRAVLLNMGEYERLCEAVEVLQSIYEAKKRAGSGE